MRYRKWIVSLLALLLLLGMAAPVLAAEYTYVTDEADILTAGEKERLEEVAEQISIYHGCGLYIVTVWDYHEYGSNARDAAEQYFLSHEFGLGSDQSGLLLFLSMAGRDYALITHGSLGNSAFTDYGVEALCEEFLDDFRYDDWYAGFADYLYCSEDYLQAAAEGAPVDKWQGSDGVVLTLALVLLVPGAIAGLTCGVMASSMKSAVRKAHADDYIQQRGIQLTHRRDRFLTRTVVRQKIETSSSGGGRGSRGGSRGFSGRSGKF